MFTRKHTLDETFFDTIDTEEKAYWLGFIAADGYVNDRHRLGITLHAKDVEHLRLFKKALSATYPVAVRQSKHKAYKRPGYYMAQLCTFQVTSRRLVDALGRLGIVPRKSLILHFPTPMQVPLRLRRHFIRGYFDGDGCISSSASWQASILGTLQFTYTCMGALGVAVPRCHMIVRKKRKIYDLVITSRDAIERFRRYLYDGATVWLPRKHCIFARFKEEYETTPDDTVSDVSAVLLGTQEAFTNRELYNLFEGRHHIKSIEMAMRSFNSCGLLIQTQSGYGHNRFRFNFEDCSILTRQAA